MSNLRKTPFPQQNVKPQSPVGARFFFLSFQSKQQK